MKPVIIILGLVLVIAGFGLLGFSTMVGRIDTGSVTFLLSEDRIGPETLSGFTFTQWREPTAGIRPFHYRDKSFEDCKILRYRRGFKPTLFIWCTYYEAEYEKPDGTRIIGPAFGSLPYSAPNLLVSVPIILAGIVVFTIGIKLKKVSHLSLGD